MSAHPNQKEKNKSTTSVSLRVTALSTSRTQVPQGLRLHGQFERTAQAAVSVAPSFEPGQEEPQQVPRFGVTPQRPSFGFPTLPRRALFPPKSFRSRKLGCLHKTSGLSNFSEGTVVRKTHFERAQTFAGTRKGIDFPSC